MTPPEDLLQQIDDTLNEMKRKARRQASTLKYVESFLPGFTSNEGYEFITEAEFDRTSFVSSYFPLQRLR